MPADQSELERDRAELRKKQPHVSGKEGSVAQGDPVLCAATHTGFVFITKNADRVPIGRAYQIIAANPRG